MSVQQLLMFGWYCVLTHNTADHLKGLKKINTHKIKDLQNSEFF